MDDEVHHAICKEFIRILAERHAISYLLAIVDSDYYKDIFTYTNSKYQWNVIRSICYAAACDIALPIIKHILITRKIANIQSTIALIAYHFDKDINYTQLFSFYNNAEILDLINNNAHYSCNCYINKRSVKFTLIFECIFRDSRYNLLDYLLHYMYMYNLPIIIDADYIIGYVDISMDKCTHHMKLINKHEKKITYLNSLRHSWIMSCII